MIPRSVRLLVASTGALAGLLLVTGQILAAEIWVTNMTSANVQVIDPEKMTVIATLPAGKGCHNVAFSPDGKWAAVANVGEDTVGIIDADSRKVVHTVKAGKRGARRHLLAQQRMGGLF